MKRAFFTAETQRNSFLTLVVDPFQKVGRLHILVAIGIVLDQRVSVLIP